MANKIIKPGYHIRPQYDLHGLRQRRTDDHKGALHAELPLTAMIDMFSILVIYLLMNFSATGDPFFMSKPGVVLPTSGTSHELVSAPLLSYVGGSFHLDALTPSGGQLKLQDSSSNQHEIIQALKQLQSEIMAKDPKEFNGRLNIQADENTPLLYIKRGMAAGTIAGWTSINFVVVPPKQN